ncbi:hypothetical protein LIA77_04114 [Sarocladium implicatum]|nr:hypothetical protein LIA77_04114 [Sarocladium implicatum]
MTCLSKVRTPLGHVKETEGALALEQPTAASPDTQGRGRTYFATPKRKRDAFKASICGSILPASQTGGHDVSYPTSPSENYAYGGESELDHAPAAVCCNHPTQLAFPLATWSLLLRSSHADCLPPRLGKGLGAQ